MAKKKASNPGKRLGQYNDLSPAATSAADAACLAAPACARRPCHQGVDISCHRGRRQV